MIDTQKPNQDFKKWILFNNTLSDHQNLYDLYNAIKHVKVANNSSCELMTEDGATIYQIECTSVDEKLKISEEARNQLLSYLRQHYFHTDNIDEWFREKQGRHDKANNHHYLQQSHEFGNNKTGPLQDIKPHPKESRYFNIKLFFAILGYTIISGFLVITFLASPFEAFQYLLGFGLIVLLLIFLRWIVKGFMIGYIKGNAVKITDKQYPEVYNIVKSRLNNCN